VIGLAVLAKIVMLICAAGVLAAVLLAGELRGNWRLAAALIAAATAGLMVVLGAWELVTLAALGWPGYLARWSRFWLLMQLGGSGLGAVVPPSFGSHVAALAGFLGRPAPVAWVGLALATAATGAALLPSFVQRLRSRDAHPMPRSQSFAAWSLALATAAYWGWWLCFNSTQELRHLVAGYVVLALLLPVAIALVACEATASRVARRTAIAALAAAALCLFPLRWPLPSLSGAELAHQETVARAVQLTSAMDAKAVFWGFGWRQAPEISFLAQLPFRDITLHAPTPTEHNFLVVSGSSFSGPQTLIRYAQPHCGPHLVQAGRSSVCRLKPTAPKAVDTMLRP
jgi:hypothetical protein